MFYGRSVSGRYGLGAPFCSFTQQGPDSTQGQAPNHANPSPSPSPRPLPADKLGGSGVGGRASGQVWRGSSRLWGKHTGTVKTPTLRVEQSQPSQHPTPPPGKEHTHVKPTYLLRFSSPPRGCRHLCIPSNSSLVAEMYSSSSLEVSQPPSDCAPPRPQHSSHGKGTTERKMKKIIFTATWRFFASRET